MDDKITWMIIGNDPIDESSNDCNHDHDHDNDNYNHDDDDDDAKSKQRRALVSQYRGLVLNWSNKMRALRSWESDGSVQREAYFNF